MTFLPIVERELRVAARRRGTYWSRVGAALIALLISGYTYLVSRRVGSPQELGMILFTFLAWVCFLHCLLAGAPLTSDSVSEEKREGTLGLLFLTDLRAYDILLGKLVALSLSSVYGLLAIFPVLAITLMMGGVSAQQFWSVVLVLLNTLFLSLTAGMFFSTVATRGRQAAAFSFLFLLMITVSPPVFAVLWAGFHQLSRPILEMMYPSPAYPLGVVLLQMRARFSPEGFWLSISLVQAMGWGFLLLSSLILPRVWQDKPTTPWGARLRARWQAWAYGNAAQRAAFRQRLLEVNPFFWLAARDRLKPAYVWTFLGLAGALWLWAFLYQRDFWQDAGLNWALIISLHSIMKFWMGAAVVQRLAEDRRSAALELLLATPLTTTEIFRGQLRALGRQFAGPIVALLVADVLLCHDTLRVTYQDRPLVVAFHAALMVMLLADAYAIGWTGMSTAVTTKHPSHASANVLVRILVLPWLALIGLFTLFGLLEAYGRIHFNPNAEHFLALWFALGIANDCIFTLWSARWLREKFRICATERFQPRRAGWLTTLFGTQ